MHPKIDLLRAKHTKLDSVKVWTRDCLIINRTYQASEKFKTTEPSETYKGNALLHSLEVWAEYTKTLRID